MHKTELVRHFVIMEMNKRKAELEAVKDKLNGVLSIFKKKIEKVMRVITTIELYLGIDEELFQIQDGEKASKDEPITFRQQVLYMDEEIGHWENGGLDFTNIDWFDKWLVENDNYKKIVPEEKCLVVFRPRRNDKNYGDSYYNNVINRENKYRTYLLIRNGECLYRVYTENIVILPRLFPKRDELEKLIMEVDKEMKKGSFFRTDEAKERVDDMMYQYKKRAVLMQGLIDRTEVFHPLPAEKVDIFNLDNLGDKVRFIYDDEDALPSGRLPFNAWREKINSKITKGSRVIITGGYDSRDVSERIFYYCNEYNTPPSPSIGVYDVELYEQEFTKNIYVRGSVNDDEFINEFKNDYPRHRLKESYKTIGGSTCEVYLYYQSKEPNPKLTILHNPKDTVHGGWGKYWETGERKKRIRFTIHKSDIQVLNYDQIDLDDIDFYLTSRVDRHNYLSMMPILIRIKEQRLKELELEKSFVKMVTDRNSKDKDPIVVEKIVWELVEWWKYKNTWKRPIDSDDAKALRMIESELKRRL